MQRLKNPPILILSCLLLAAGLTTANAQTVTNADSSDPLNLGTSWVGGVPAGSANIAVWDSTVQLNTSKTLGANLAWAGIQVFNPASAITIAADGNSLATGASGIDLSQATVGLTLGCPVILGANQTWNVTNSLALNINGQLLASTGTTLTLNGPGEVQFTSTVNGTYVGNVVLNGGILNIGGANGNNNSAIGTGAITNNGGTLLSANKIVGNVLYFTGTSIVDANLSNFTLDGAWQGSGTVIVSNMTSSSTVTAGGNGNGGGSMANFTGTVIVSDTNRDGTTTAGNFRFNNGSPNNNVGNAAMTLNLGNGNAHFTEKNSSVTTTFGALYGGPNTQLASAEKYIIGTLNLVNDIFSGTITGAAATLTKNGTGTLTLNNTNANTYTGATTVNNGVLQLGDGVTPVAGFLGATPIVVNIPGVFVINKPDDFSTTNGISGAGNVLKTNVDAFTYYGTNSGSGTVMIGQGSWILGSSALMAAPVFVGPGTIFDVSQDTAFSLNQTLSGFGGINGLLTATGGAISPGQPGVAGTLTFSNGLTELGGANNQFEIAAGSNDLVNVIGDLTVSGANTITVSAFGGGVIPNGVYPVINYSGAFSGSLANFNVSAVGASGTLTNITTTTPAQIAVIITPPSRAATNLLWKGDGSLNNWDSTSSNWVSGATAFAFQAGDRVTFDDSGAPNTNVNLIIPTLPGSVTFSNTVPYTLAGGGSIGGSVGLTKTNSGSLLLLTTNTYTGPTLVEQGTLEVQNLGISGAPSAIGASSSDPSNLVISSSVFKYSGASGNTDHGITLNGSGATLDVIGGTTLTLNGNIAGPGTLKLVDSGTLNLAQANTYNGGTVISNGVLALGSNNANNNGAGDSGVGPTNSPVTFYGGTLRLFGAGASTANNYSTLYNPLIVPAGQTGTLIMFPRGPVNTGSGAGLFSSLSGGGTLNLEVNYVRDALSGDWSAFTGLILVTNFNATGDEMRINNNFGYANASIYLNGPVIMDSTLNSGATINIGDLGGVVTATIGAGNSSSPNPTWVVGWKNTSDTFAGTIQDDGHSSIVKVGTGTWYLAGSNPFSGSTIISNGVLSLTNIGIGDGAITASTNIFVGSGAILDVSGRSDGTMPLNFGQVLSGNGTVYGNVDTSAGGTVSAGGGIYGGTGILTVTNSVNLAGTSWMKLSRTSAQNSDRIVSPSINLNNGTLIVTNIGPSLKAGDTFTLFSGTLSGAFGTVILPNYYTWDTTQLAANGTIRVVSFNPPGLAVDFSTLSSGTITFTASNGLANGPVSVLSSTNLSLPVSAWTNVVSGNFDGSGNFTSPATVDPTVPTQFFILSVQ